MADIYRPERTGHDRNAHQEERPHLQPDHHHRAQDRQAHDHQPVALLHRVVRRRRPLRRDPLPDHARLHRPRHRQPGPEEGQRRPCRRRLSRDSSVHRRGAGRHARCCWGVARRHGRGYGVERQEGRQEEEGVEPGKKVEEDTGTRRLAGAPNICRDGILSGIW